MSAMLASDANNPNFVGAHNPDAALVVRFYNRAVQNNYETSKQGRPIFQDVVYVEIFTPGNQLNIIDTPMREEHKHRFPMQWARYQNSHGDTREAGTPVNQWPLLSASQAEEFKALKFFTVESIANASDSNINNLGMIGGMSPMILRDKALAYLRAASDTALPQHQVEELAKRDAQIAALSAQLAQLAEAVAAKTAPRKRTEKPAEVEEVAEAAEASM